jgi:Nematode insulin-related peptide beta type.
MIFFWFVGFSLIVIVSPKVRLCGQKLVNIVISICKGCIHGTKWDRKTRGIGIANECCERTCNFSYLKSFCCLTNIK